MANLKGTGAPTKKTVAAIGDVYTDTTTGKQYKCTFAYRTDNDTDFDCSWVELKGVKVEEPVEKKVEKPVEEMKHEQVENPVGKKEPDQAKTPKSSNHTNYAAYGKKN